LEELRQAGETAGQVEDEGVRVVPLQVGDQEIERKRLPYPGASQHERVRGVAVVEVKEVARLVVGFEDRQIFPPQMPVFGPLGR